MLERQEAEKFVDLLSNNDETLLTISNKFHSLLNVRNRMIALTGISMLLSDGLLEHTQQIVATWLLYNEFKTVPINDSPFLPVFVHIYNEVRISNPNFCPPQLYDIISCILDNVDTEKIGSMSLKSIMSPNMSLPTSINLSAPKQYQPRISPILSEKPENPENPEGEILTPSQILVELLTDSTIYNDFEPPFIRPAPDVSPIFPGEIQQTFISSYDSPPALFDEYVSLNSKEMAISLIKKAADTQLTPKDVDFLSREIKKNPELSSEAKLSNAQIDTLIENNPDIAKDIVLSLVKRNDRVLEQLSNAQLTPTKAQVIQEILINPDLPTQQFESYIFNTMNNLKGIQGSEAYSKSVPLFFDMLCAAFNKGKRFSVDLLVELYSFCVLPKNERLPESQKLAALLSE